MAKVIPFCGMRYNTDMFKNLADVTAPPYDAISPAEQENLYNKSEYNIVRIDYGMGQAGDNADNNPCTRGGELLKKWIDEQVLVRDSKPALYIYEQIFSLNDGEAAHSMKGIISLVELCEYSEGVILPHEETVSGIKDDRLELMRSTGANTNPVFSLYYDDEETIANLVEECSDAAPDISFVTDEGVRQNIWVVTDEKIISRISGLFEHKQLFIADGHHRYEAALNYRRERHGLCDTEMGSADYDYVMMMLVSMSSGGLFTFPTHRLVRNAERFDENLMIGCLTQEFLVSKIHFTDGDFASIITDRLSKTVDEKLFAIYTGGNYYYLLKLKDTQQIDTAITDKSEAYRHLDVTLLHKMMLEEYLGIDEESMKKQNNLVYMREASEAIAAVKEGIYQCAFLINPTKVSQIREIALAGEKMPQKSTYFWPKLVTGLVINKFKD